MRFSSGSDGKQAAVV